MSRNTNGGIVKTRCLKCSAAFSVNTRPLVLKSHLLTDGYFLNDDSERYIRSEGRLFARAPPPADHARVQLEKYLVQ